METNAINMTTTYQEVVDNVDYAIQNIGKNQIEFVFSDIEPIAGRKGHILRTYDGALTGWATGKIWARSIIGTGILAVTK